jgi:mevalonate kinase
MNRFCLICTIASFAIFAAQAQSPAPATVASTTTTDSESLPLSLKQLQEIKTANQELLKKQEAALQKLEELQKAADEIKIFSKRS